MVGFHRAVICRAGAVMADDVVSQQNARLPGKKDLSSWLAILYGL